MPKPVFVPNLREYARTVASPETNLRFHPVFQGYRSRPYTYECQTNWSRSGNFHLLLVVQDGQIDIQLEASLHSMLPGSAFLLPPAARPDITFCKGVRYHETYFSVWKDLREILCSEGFVIRNRAWILAQTLDALADALHVDPAADSARYCLALALSQLHESPIDATPVERGLTDRQRQEVLRFVRDNLDGAAHPDSMARVAGLSHDYFTRLFRLSFGMSPRDWVTREKIREACRLLDETVLRVKEISQRLGYESQVSFGRQFREVVGTSPERYRRRHAEVSPHD